jgi:16S rRNA (guanine966-N2)-methyltransferase
VPRVVGGSLAGRTLHAPPGRGTRPTLDRVREALFNILAPRVQDAVVLDLFAGTGALAIEALSRGARLAILVEPDPRVRPVIHRNLASLGLSDSTDVWASTAERAVGRLPAARFNLIFCDPPWDMGVPEKVAAALPRLLVPGGLAVVERPIEAPRLHEPGLRLVDDRRYGRTKLDFWTRPVPVEVEP